MISRIIDARLLVNWVTEVENMASSEDNFHKTKEKNEELSKTYFISLQTIKNKEKWIQSKIDSKAYLNKTSVKLSSLFSYGKISKEKRDRISECSFLCRSIADDLLVEGEFLKLINNRNKKNKV